MTYKTFIVLCVLLVALDCSTLDAQWHVSNSMHVGRVFHTATLLANGNVLVAGGMNGSGSLSSCEVYDPTVDRWTITAPMSHRRFGHTATVLPDGKVLVTGGYDYQKSVHLQSCEVFDPIRATWSLTDSMRAWRSQHTAILLDDGRVLVVGGDYSKTSEIYDLSIGKWHATNSTNEARMGHTATKLMDGRVMVVGSWGAGWEYWYYHSTCEVFDPSTNSWSFSDSMYNPRAFHSTAILSDGRLFVSGGENSTHIHQCEVYDPSRNVWLLSDSLLQPRTSHRSITLTNGDVLIIGGQYGTDPQTDYHALRSCELYKRNGTIVRTDSLAIARYGHGATLLLDGDVLATGGADGLHFSRTYLSSCERYTPVTTNIHDEGDIVESSHRCELSNNYPNPCNPSTAIRYTLTKASHVVLKVFDVLGREVVTLVDEIEQPGTRSVPFDVSGIASGVYFYRLQAGLYIETKRMLVLR